MTRKTRNYGKELSKRGGRPAALEELSTTLHINLAKEHEKKIWLVSSGASQSAHLPVAGPNLDATKRLEGRRSRISCQVKIGILSGSLAAHTSLACATDAPSDSFWYMEDWYMEDTE
jgi:hypothetical protein